MKLYWATSPQAGVGPCDTARYRNNTHLPLEDKWILFIDNLPHCDTLYLFIEYMGSEQPILKIWSESHGCTEQ